MFSLIAVQQNNHGQRFGIKLKEMTSACQRYIVLCNSLYNSHDVPRNILDSTFVSCLRNIDHAPSPQTDVSYLMDTVAYERYCNHNICCHLLLVKVKLHSCDTLAHLCRSTSKIMSLDKAGNVVFHDEAELTS